MSAVHVIFIRLIKLATHHNNGLVPSLMMLLWFNVTCCPALIISTSVSTFKQLLVSHSLVLWRSLPASFILLGCFPWSALPSPTVLLNVLEFVVGLSVLFFLHSVWLIRLILWEIQMNLVPLSEPNTSFWHHALALDQEGVVGAFQECVKANCGYPAACFQLRKASSFIVPGNKESIYIRPSLDGAFYARWGIFWSFCQAFWAHLISNLQCWSSM